MFNRLNLWLPSLPWFRRGSEVAPLEISLTAINGMNTRVYPGFTPLVVGGVFPYTFSISAGTLPTGLSIDPDSGTISGTPTVNGTQSNIRIRVTDDDGNFEDSDPFSIQIFANLTLTGTPPSGVQNSSYNFGAGYQLVRSGGQTPWSFAVTAGTLPTGLSLNSSSGLISGTPTVVQNQTGIQVTVTDNMGYTAVLGPFAINIEDPSFSFANAEAAAIVAAMTATPLESRMQLIDDTVGALKAAGLWAKLDILYLMAAHTNQAGRLNWKSPANYALVNQGTGQPGFVADRGFNGNSSSGGPKLEAQFRAVNYVNFQWASRCYGIWSTDSAVYQQSYAIGGSSERFAELSPRFLSGGQNLFVGNIGGANDFNTPTIADGRGLFVMNRSGSAASQFYQNGVSIKTNTNTPSNPDFAADTTNTFGVGALGSNTQSTPRQTAAMFIGGSLNGTEQANLFAILEDYMQAVGAA